MCSDGLKRRPRDSLDDLPIRGVRHARQVFLNDGTGARQVPVEVAMNRGVVETVQRAIEAADGPAKAFEQRGRARANLSEGNALEIGDEPHEMNIARHHGDQVAGPRRQRVRAQRDPSGDVRHRGVLGLEHRTIFGRVRDLEHEATSPQSASLRCRFQEKVLIPLARKRRRAGGEAVDVAREALGLGDGKLRRLLEERHGRYGRFPKS